MGITRWLHCANVVERMTVGREGKERQRERKRERGRERQREKEIEKKRER